MNYFQIAVMFLELGVILYQNKKLTEKSITDDFAKFIHKTEHWTLSCLLKTLSKVEKYIKEKEDAELKEWYENLMQEFETELNSYMPGRDDD